MQYIENQMQMDNRVEAFSTSFAIYRNQAKFFVVLADGLLKNGFSEFPSRQRVKTSGDY